MHRLVSRFLSLVLFAAVCTLALPAAHAQTCPFDNGGSTLANDGLVMTRYALGLRGADLVNNTAFAAIDAPTIESNITCPSCGLNVTGQVDGASNPAFTVADATIISRKIAGFSGAQLTNGLNLGSGARSTPAAVQSFLLSGCGLGGALPSCLQGQVLKFAANGSLQCGNTPSTTNTFGAAAADSLSMAIKADGRPVMSYLDGGSKLRVLRCGTADCAVGNASLEVDSLVVGASGFGTSIAVPADGLPVISYSDSTSRLRVVKCGDPDCTSGNTRTTLDPGFTSGTFSSIAVPTDGLPVISHYDSSGVLRVTKCSNAFCTAAVSVTADPGPNIGRYTSIAVPADGRPVISYTATTGFVASALKVVKCGNSSCSAGNIITTMDAVAGAGGFTSVAVPTDGLPVVSYQFANTTTSLLKVAKCGNASCTSGNALTDVDAPTSPAAWGYNTSLAVGADGRPVIVHANGNRTGSIRVVKCGNAACSSGNQASYVVGESAMSLQLPVIKLAPDGLPIIAYISNSVSGAIVAVKCSNTGCVAP
jgi:hypothetical protein